MLQLLWSRVEFGAIFSGGLLLVTIGFAYDSPEPQKSVLVLYSERGDLPAIQAIEENLREVFHAATLERGAIAFLVKPFDDEEFLAVVHSALADLPGVSR